MSKIEESDKNNVITLDCLNPPQNINGLTYIPLRSLAEALDSQVNWNGENKVINIITSYDTNSDNVIYKFNNGTLTIGGRDEMRDQSLTRTKSWKELDIEYVVIESGVTSISNYAFSGCKNLVSVKIPNTVKKIGEKAFYDCSSLKDIKIP